MAIGSCSWTTMQPFPEGIPFIFRNADWVFVLEFHLQFFPAPGVLGFVMILSDFPSVSVRCTAGCLRFQMQPGSLMLLHQISFHWIMKFPLTAFWVVIRSPLHFPLWAAPALLSVPFLVTKSFLHLLRRLAGRIVRQDAAAILMDTTHWHYNSIEWLRESAVFTIDGEIILKTPFSSSPPLGIVLWIDNQYAAWKPDGSIGFGSLPNPYACLEMTDICLDRL